MSLQICDGVEAGLLCNCIAIIVPFPLNAMMDYSAASVPP